MSRIETARNILQARILYWGPAGAGKTASLLGLRRILDPEERAPLYSVVGAEGATALFDVLPVEEFRLGPYRTRVRVMSTPGAPRGEPFRRSLLRDADVVVFVADGRSEAREANRLSVDELRTAMRELEHPVPVVLACTRQDLPGALPAADMKGELHIAGPAFDVSVPDGRGVFEAFSEAFRLLLEEVGRRHGILDTSGAAAPHHLLPQLVRGAGPSRRPGQPHVVLEVPAEEPSAAARALHAQLALVEAHVEAASTNRMLEGRNRELMAINRVARSILSAMEADNLLVVLLDATAEHLGATHASCVVFDPSDTGQLRTHVLGFGRDPALRLLPEGAKRFLALLKDSDGPVPATDEYNPELLAELRKVDVRVRRGLFQPIKGNESRPAGWLAIYAMGDEPPLSTQGLLFLSSISRLAALGLDKIAMLDKVQRLSADREEEVHRRTSQLEMANAKIRALNRGLEARVTERTRALEEANRQLREARAGAVHAARLRGMGQVAASFAHEVNNPVAGLTGNLDLMRETLDALRTRVAGSGPDAADGLAALDEFEEIIRESRESAERITAIIASLKRFGGEEKPSNRFSLNAIVADALTLVEERALAAAELDLKLGTLPEMDGDGQELGHVVLSLLTNAIEALERRETPGHLSITTYAAAGKAALVVQDDGPGVEPAVLERAFEPFVTTKEGQPSAGLGLHIAYKAIQRAGGTIRIRSKPREGTTVTVVLPLKRPAGGAAPAQARDKEGSKP